VTDKPEPKAERKPADPDFAECPGVLKWGTIWATVYYCPECKHVGTAQHQRKTCAAPVYTGAIK
jgi:hypothetical protein